MRNNPLLSFLACLFFPVLAQAQVVVTYQTPDSLFICGTDTLTVTVTNGGATALGGIQLQLNLPAGLVYESGTAIGATEVNLSDPMVPVFSLQNVAAGNERTARFVLSPGCALVAAANGGQLFSVGIGLTANGGVSQTVQSNFFKIETGLLVLLPPQPTMLMGEIGDTLRRTIRVQNTRLGKVGAFRFQDQHGGGIQVWTPDLGGSYIANGLWEATVGTSVIQQHGNGNEWFELNEIIDFEELILVDSCGESNIIVPSILRGLWGCDMALCQYDSLKTEDIIVKPSTKNPDLVFVPSYQVHRDECANHPQFQTLTVTNQGNVAAKNVILTYLAGQKNALDGEKAEVNQGAGWMPLPPTLLIPRIWSCDLGFDSSVVLTLPNVPAGATYEVRIPMVVCAPGPDPDGFEHKFTLSTFYRKECPANQPVGEEFVMGPSPKADLKGVLYYDLRECLQVGENRTFLLYAKSGLMESDSGYLHFEVRLPRHIAWDSTCPLIIQGKPAEDFSATQLGRFNIYTFKFPLPLNKDSVATPFCVTVTDCPFPPCSNGSIGAFPSNTVANVHALDLNDCPFPCEQKGFLITSLTLEPDADPRCGLVDSSDYVLFTNNICDTNDTSQGMCFPGGFIVASFDTWRTNIDFQDDNNDRIADSNLEAMHAGVRRDRFVAGDSLRATLTGVYYGSIPIDAFTYQIFTEMIQSEQAFGGASDGDLLMDDARRGFTDTPSVMVYAIEFDIHRSDGSMETCTGKVGTTGIRNGFSIVPVNSNPPVIYDYLASKWDRVTVDFSGCPSNVAMQDGDSIVVRTDFKICSDFNRNVPRNELKVYNFRSSVPGLIVPFAYNLWPLTKMSQFSGQLDSLVFPKSNIRLCETSLETKPFSYAKLIARDNFFPYEVRPLTRITQMGFDIPKGLALRSAFAKAELQSNIPLFNNTPVDWTINGSLYDFDMAPLFAEPLDEGFGMQVNFLYEPSCDYLLPDTSTFELTITKPACYTPPYDSWKSKDPLAFLSNAPDLSLQSDTLLLLNSPFLSLDMVLKNLRVGQGPNAYIFAVPVNGNLTDQKFYLGGSSTPLPQIGGVTQLGNIGSFASNDLRFEATALNCQSLFVDIIYGYNCSPMNSTAEVPCHADTLRIEIRLEATELELDILTEPATIPLCAESDVFVFEVFNAKFGRAFDLRPSLRLPPGIRIAPGTSQIYYPANGTPAPLPDPTTATNNTYFWDLSNKFPSGLPGIDGAPSNNFRIQFKVLAECGAVSNEQAVYGIDGIQPCGAMTNSIRKTGQPLRLDGFPVPSGLAVGLTGPNAPLSCGQTGTFNISIQLQAGTTSANDTAYIDLPAGFSFLNYTPGTNAPTAQPLVVGNQLRLKLPVGIGAGQQINFSLSLQFNDPGDCFDRTLSVGVRQVVSAFCATTGADCNTFQSLGQGLLTIATQQGSVQISGVAISASSPNQTSVGFTLLNSGNDPLPAGTPVRAYSDMNGNGILDAGDALLGTILTPDAINANGTANLILDVPQAPAALCGVILVVEKNSFCACEDYVVSFPSDFIIPYAEKVICGVQNAFPGPANTLSAGNLTWSASAGVLSCYTCENPIFSPPADAQPGSTYTITLLEPRFSCNARHIFTIRIEQIPAIQNQDTRICAGESLTLRPTIANGTYTWSGPGITNPSQTNQTVSPTSDAMYILNMSSPTGCQGRDTVLVKVNQKSTTTLPMTRTCIGTPVALPGVVTDVAGNYCITLVNQFGCDSVVCQELTLAPNTESSVEICAGDSIQINGEWARIGDVVCASFQSSIGCDTTHCVRVRQLQFNTGLPDTTEVSAVPGSEVLLTGPTGFSSYTWFAGTDSLSCTNCPTPTTYPQRVGTYLVTLVLTNAVGCADTLYWRVTSRAECNLPRIPIPNAFVPESQTPENQKFRPVFPVEGVEETISMTIYDRWGEKLFVGTGKNAAWDGKVEGKLMPSEVYVYLITIGCPDGSAELRKGDVTLIR